MQQPEEMIVFPEGITFKYPWRKYQQRVLDELQDHLSDRHLHVIAPPGSGKTVLGLEVALRLNKPVLILAPTIAIRNQWIQRFCELFLQTKAVPEWISRDIRKPGFMTVVTYQGLHAACIGGIEEEIEPEEDSEEFVNENGTSANTDLDQVVAELRRCQLGVIVVDEAHHLKNEWWQTLNALKKRLKTILVGLTATPPYDVSFNEWQRYVELNGPVDTEISVPELVIEGDLCPHQDYVYFTEPTATEQAYISEFRSGVTALFNELRRDEHLIKAIEEWEVWQDPTGHLNWIYENLACYSACIIFLNDNKRIIPAVHLEVIGNSNLDIPVLDLDWLAVFLDFYLYKSKGIFLLSDYQTKLEDRLRRRGIIERKQIDFSQNKRVTGFLTASISKLYGIRNIVNFEYDQLGRELRMVILSDYIRKEFFVQGPENTTELNKLGVIPIFEMLRRSNPHNMRLGVLTGSMIIIPASASKALLSRAKEHHISDIKMEPVPYDQEYLLVQQTEKLKHAIVHLVTDIFQSGEIEILIGTKSLLGEGWDAPAINTLILASFVGSYVSSNQMRGRAIRSENGNVEKTGNIWHLACLDHSAKDGGTDFDLLKRRFTGFVGLSLGDQPTIENGMRRLNLPSDIQNRLEMINDRTFLFARSRNQLKERWQQALDKGVNLVEELKVPFRGEREYQTVKALYFNKTIANLLATLGTGVLVYGFAVLGGMGRATGRVKNMSDLYILLAVLLGGLMLFTGRLALKSLRLYFQYRDVSKDIRQIAHVLLKTLLETKLIQTESSVLRVDSSLDKNGAVYCHLLGGTTLDKSMFINCLKELIEPIANPRYVIIRKNGARNFVKRDDYHAVPEVLGRKKEYAVLFSEHWERHVGACELVYTRTLSGRKLLLKSRVESLSTQLNDSVECINKWR